MAQYIGTVLAIMSLILATVLWVGEKWGWKGSARGGAGLLEAIFSHHLGGIHILSV